MQCSKYQSLSIKRKLEIIDAVEKAPAGKKKKEIATEFGILTSTLCGTLKKKACPMEEIQENAIEIHHRQM